MVKPYVQTVKTLEEKCQKEEKKEQQINECMKQGGWEDGDDEIIEACDNKFGDDSSSSGYSFSSNETVFICLVYFFWIYV